ncbi:MAG: phosphoribosylaminoimidazolesuccinocarboxamide synthase [Cyanobacteria bacterium K_Offshore_surface_m2_239]|nr:phosphoribosylaminoimidazolesuccinocarboxamide synthase [Cyanobacteria bacterium K_Offshore_surface_m2_239]
MSFPFQLGALLHEGKAKRVHATDRTDVLAVEFKDDATAFNAAKKASLAGKGVTNCRISALLFDHLARRGVPSHHLGLLQPGWVAVRPVTIVPLEVVIRNRAAGSLCRQLPVAAGSLLEPPLLDLYYKDDALGDPLLTEARLERLALVTPAERRTIEDLARRINAELQALFAGVDLDLVDFKIEFGRDSSGAILLADEISPDTCRLWNRSSSDENERILDKDRFRQDLGGVVEAYGEVLKRVEGVCPEPGFYR